MNKSTSPLQLNSVRVLPSMAAVTAPPATTIELNRPVGRGLVASRPMIDKRLKRASVKVVTQLSWDLGDCMILGRLLSRGFSAAIRSPPGLNKDTKLSRQSSPVRRHRRLGHTRSDQWAERTRVSETEGLKNRSLVGPSGCSQYLLGDLDDLDRRENKTT